MVSITVLTNVLRETIQQMSRAKILIAIFFKISDLALKMVKERDKLAFIRDENEETALHLLAQNQMPLDSGCHGPEHDHNPGK
jgi:hypothetical protein